MGSISSNLIFKFFSLHFINSLIIKVIADTNFGDENVMGGFIQEGWNSPGCLSSFRQSG
jgi:hypothetical protein